MVTFKIQRKSAFISGCARLYDASADGTIVPGSKCTFGQIRPAKIQISLRSHTDRLVSSLCTFWTASDEEFIHADNEDSEQTERMFMTEGL